MTRIVLKFKKIKKKDDNESKSVTKNNEQHSIK